MSDKILHERKPGDERCSFNYCRKEYEFRYLPRATVLNPKKQVQVCVGHHSEFHRMMLAISWTKKDQERMARQGRPRSILRKKLQRKTIERKELKR